MRKIIPIALCVALLMAGCSSHRLSQGRSFRLNRVSFSDLPGWKDEDLNDAYPALERACIKPQKEWKKFCSGIGEYKYAPSRKLRAYLEKELTPYQVISYGNKTGRITGYYESELTGTRYHQNGTQVPIYGAPADYVKGKTYPKRADIEKNGLDAPIIAWANDPVDLFLMHVQGSGRMETPNGEIHLGFAGSNNRSFTGIGQILADEGLLDKVGHSMVQMRAWLKENPDKARKLLAKNDRYIFFREIQGETPVGTAGVPLTPFHSVAVDTAYIPMQTPMWLVTTRPDGDQVQTLVVAQDTGAAIKGGIRADYFFGHGEHAFSEAGRMNTTGSYYLLLPD